MSWWNPPAGPGGGYSLGRKAADITVADIIVSVDEPIDATQCGGKENCQGDGGRCMTHELWASLNQRMVEFLDSVTLQKLVDDQLAKGMQIEDKPAVKRAISSQPVVKPIRVNAPNSVFALGQFVRQVVVCSSVAISQYRARIAEDLISFIASQHEASHGHDPALPDLHGLRRDDAGRPARRGRDDSVVARAFRQPGVAQPCLGLGSGSGGGKGPRRRSPT